MKNKEIKARLEKILNKNRYEHTLSVAKLGAKLAKTYGEDPKKAKKAGLLHDCAKGSEQIYFEKYEDMYDLDQAFFQDKVKLHSYLGYIVAKEEYGVLDEDILNAIKYHTTGRVEMSKLEKIIYVADAVDYTRKYAGVEELRNLAFEDLDLALIEIMNNSLIYIIKNKMICDIETVKARNYYIMKELEIRGKK